MNPIRFLRLLALIVAASSAAFALSAENGIASTLSLIRLHAANVGRLAQPAEASATALVSGGHYYLAGDPTWVAEGSRRAGGTLAAAELPAPASVRRGDLVWLGYSAQTFDASMSLASKLERQGAIVIYFGPIAPPPHARKRWLDSLTGSDRSDIAVLLGNILSLWTETGELAAATARRGRTLVFLQSHVIFGATDREKLYPGPVWHTVWPVMKPMPSGAIARQYLDHLDGLLTKLQDTEGSRLAEIAQELALRTSHGQPAILLASGGHVTPRLLPSPADPSAITQGRAARPALPSPLAFLDQNDLVVFFGYTSIPRDLLGAIHRARAKAVWIVSPLPQDKDVTEFGDTIIDQGWTIGDAAVHFPGYDIRILPPSAVVELAIYRALGLGRGGSSNKP